MPGGIIFIAILALWAVYLVPLLVRERASRLDSRAGDRTSPAVRVLQRPPAQRLSHRVVLTVDRPVVSEDLPARPTRDLARTLRAQAVKQRTAVRLRAAGALVGVVALLLTGAAAVVGALPWWSLAVAAGWLTGVLATGAVAASSARRTDAPAPRATALPPRARRVATEVFDGRVSRPAAPLTAPVEVEPAAEVPAERTRAGQVWTPTELPGPVYASKPVSHRPPALPWSLPPVAPEDESAAEAPVETDPPEQAAPAEPAAEATTEHPRSATA